MMRSALMALSATLLLTACGAKLPEPESEAAQLYVAYCSGSGCHGAIPPQSDGVRYWETQYGRMIELMRTRGLDLPSAKEDQLIRDYLQRHAYRP